ncbi:MAG: hypothetical protein KJ645_10790, partial [Planctomycetes bacterium]|nr:hypothetical protein [Planctomycetota bacterium]
MAINARNCTVLYLTLIFFLLLQASSEGASVVVHGPRGLFLKGELGQVQVLADEEGRAVFEGDGICWLNEPGMPRLPWQAWTVLLPPETDLDSLTCNVRNLSYQAAGMLEVAPETPPATWTEEGEQIFAWPKNREILNGRDRSVYGKNAFWPVEPVQLVSFGRLGPWCLAEVAVPLFRYNPASFSLERLESAKVELDYVLEDRGKELRYSSATGPARVARLASNFDQASLWYANISKSGISKADDSGKRIALEPVGRKAGASLAPEGAGYAIITVQSIVDSSAKLADFIAHKTARGFNVHLITEDQWGGGSGDTAADNLR